MASAASPTAGTGTSTSAIPSVPGLEGIVPAGVVTGDSLLKLFEYCRTNGLALPAFNCTSSSTINAVLQAARDNKSPVIVQISNDLRNLANDVDISKARASAVAHSVALANYARDIAKFYGVPVVLHSQHSVAEPLLWLDAMLKADEKFFEDNGEPLFSSHALDLSKEDVDTCIKYFTRMSELNIWLDLQFDNTGGEKHNTDNTNKSADELYTKAKEVYNNLTAIGPNFSISAFGNEAIATPPRAPAFLVSQGSPTSSDENITKAVKNGIVKMNVEVGNPEGEESMIKRANEWFTSLHAVNVNVNVCGDDWTFGQGAKPAEVWTHKDVQLETLKAALATLREKIAKQKRDLRKAGPGEVLCPAPLCNKIVAKGEEAMSLHQDHHLCTVTKEGRDKRVQDLAEQMDMLGQPLKYSFCPNCQYVYANKHFSDHKC